MNDPSTGQQRSEEITPATLPRLPKREPESHKGSFGTTLVIGGSRGMTGAVALAGMAALRGGAGLVRLAVADVCLDSVAIIEPSYLTTPLASDSAGRISLNSRSLVASAAQRATAAALGPGLGRSLGLDALVSWLYRNLKLPMVVDADALNALADRPEVLRQPGGPRILTPHPGEFARLTGARHAAGIPEREADAVRMAAECGIVVVLKGHRTLVTDGTRRANNTTGNPGMATGGSGDVLTGLVGSLLAQKFSTWDAACLAVYLHGRAGDLAREVLGEESLVASDLVDYLPRAFRELHDRQGT